MDDLEFIRKKYNIIEIIWHEYGIKEKNKHIRGLNKFQIIFNEENFEIKYEKNLIKEISYFLVLLCDNLLIYSVPEKLILNNFFITYKNTEDLYLKIKKIIEKEKKIKVSCEKEDIDYLNQNHYYIISPYLPDSYYEDK